VKADLTRQASLELMRPLRAQAWAHPEAMRGQVRQSPAAGFEGRRGFDAAFLEGWAMPLPVPEKDVRPLRRGGTGAELRYMNFSVVMSASRRMPMLTAANIDGTQARRIPRSDVWRFDGRLDPEDQWGDELYNGNALDRGHMVRREDPLWGTAQDAATANEDTFHFTNACPQMAGVNQKIWLGLEDYILQNARVNGLRVNVFTGPVFGPDDLAYRGALIPLSFWKIVAIVTEDGRPSATAYLVTQDKELSQLEFIYGGYQTYQVSLRHVMDLTGLDFSSLAAYDGFSAYEQASGQPLKERLDSVDQIRV